MGRGRDPTRPAPEAQPLERDPRQYKDFEFNLRELAGSMGDFGTLFPLAIGLIVVCGMDPAALFVMMGLTNIVTGLVYRLPMPVEPKKVVSVAAIAQGWTASMVAASGLGLGLVWLALALTGLVRRLARITPVYLVRGVQLALGILLGWQALKMMAPEPWLGLLAVATILLLRQSRRAPAALVLMGAGLLIMAVRGDLGRTVAVGLTLPRFVPPTWQDVWRSMVLAGFAQVPLTITNAVLATATMIRDLFPEKAVSEQRLTLNMAAMNVASSFFGGMPMCHGSGGLAGQYYFGARTGGTNILEGSIEIALGLFLGRSLAGALAAFPMAIVGGMMLMVAVQFVRPMLALRGWPLYLALLTAAAGAASNMAVGLALGLAATALLRWLGQRGTEPQAS
ncbi:MAG: putative sulfate/molybdate transporter [Anaerolineae bacterium]|nr:putative sulfate/molybdate transporter [Anaerolineae bacterium]